MERQRVLGANRRTGYFNKTLSERLPSNGLRVFSCFVRFLVKQMGVNSEKCIEYGK